MHLNILRIISIYGMNITAMSLRCDWSPAMKVSNLRMHRRLIPVYIHTAVQKLCKYPLYQPVSSSGECAVCFLVPH